MANYDYGQVVSGIASGLGSALNMAAPGLGSLLDPVKGIGNAMSSQYKEEQTIASEQRAIAEYDRRFAMANTEYDRRQAEMNKYNSPEEQAKRLRAAGINPLSVLAGNAPVASANPSLSQPSVNASATPASVTNSPFSSISAGEALQNESTYQTGYSQWVANCLQSIKDGNAKSAGGYERNWETDFLTDVFKYNYDFVLTEDGNVEFIPRSTNSSYGKTDQSPTPDGFLSSSILGEEFDAMTKDKFPSEFGMQSVEKEFVFEHPIYGEYSFKALSPTLQHELAVLANEVGIAENTMTQVATTYINLRLAIMQGLYSGEQADANMINALANQLAAEFQYGDLWNAKSIITYATEGLGSLTDLITSIGGLFKPSFNPKRRNTKKKTEGDTKPKEEK